VGRVTRACAAECGTAGLPAIRVKITEEVGDVTLSACAKVSEDWKECAAFMPVGTSLEPKGANDIVCMWSREEEQTDGAGRPRYAVPELATTSLFG
jgi:hypothetical protein